MSADMSDIMAPLYRKHQTPSFFHLNLASKMSVSVAIDQQAWPIVRYHANRHGL